MIRRLIAWLARKEISEARLSERTSAILAVAFERQSEWQRGYLHGFSDGSDHAFDCVQKIILERTGGRSDAATMEDLTSAKKGRTH